MQKKNCITHDDDIERLPYFFMDWYTYQIYVTTWTLQLLLLQNCCCIACVCVCKKEVNVELVDTDMVSSWSMMFFWRKTHTLHHTFFCYSLSEKINVMCYTLYSIHCWIECLYYSQCKLNKPQAKAVRGYRTKSKEKRCSEWKWILLGCVPTTEGIIKSTKKSNALFQMDENDLLLLCYVFRWFITTRVHM